MLGMIARTIEVSKSVMFCISITSFPNFVRLLYFDYINSSPFTLF